MKSVVIFGGSGQIGQLLTLKLIESGYDVTIVSRSIDRARSIFGTAVRFFEWNGNNYLDILPLISHTYAIINLAGENIGSGRWTAKRKKQLYSSRVDYSKKIVKAINSVEYQPQVYWQASAIGIYSSGFLADLVKDWEDAAKAIGAETRVVLGRISVVLSRNAIFVSRFKKLFKNYIGGHIGDGNQWVSWIHEDDIISAIEFTLSNKDSVGEYNLCSPNPVSLKFYCKELGKTINRPSWLHVPSLVIKVVFGQMGKEVILGSTRVFPERLQDEGFQFRYTGIHAALKSLVHD